MPHSVGCVVFLVRQTAFREYILYAPAKEIDDIEEYMYTEVISSNWWWNEQVHCLNCVTAMMIITTLIATPASWSYDCHIICQFRPDKSYNLFKQGEDMSSIILFQNNLLDNNIEVCDLCKQSCCPSSCSSKISLYSTWKNNCHNGTTNPQSICFQECLRPYSLFTSTECILVTTSLQQ
jgi:hypothetical protein